MAKEGNSPRLTPLLFTHHHPTPSTTASLSLPWALPLAQVSADPTPMPAEASSEDP